MGNIHDALRSMRISCHYQPCTNTSQRERSGIARCVGRLAELRASPARGGSGRRASPASRCGMDAPPRAPAPGQTAEALRRARQTLAKVAKLDAVKQRLWGLELAAPVAAGAAISAGRRPPRPQAACPKKSPRWDPCQACVCLPHLLPTRPRPAPCSLRSALRPHTSAPLRTCSARCSREVT